MFLPSSGSFEAADLCWHPGGFALTVRGLLLSEFPQYGVIGNIGCGTGGGTRLIRRTVSACVGIDLCMTEPHAPCICADAHSLPMKNAAFTGLVCECVLCLLQEKDKALKEWHRVCEPHGRLLLTDVYDKRIDAMDRRIFSRQGLETALACAGWHVRLFEDYTHYLKDFAAQMLWNGVNICNYSILPDMLCAEGTSLASYGYGLWIAEKEL